MNLIDKIQKKHTEVLDFYTSEKLTERERNLLRTEMAFLLELKGDVEALNIDLVIKRDSIVLFKDELHRVDGMKGDEACVVELRERNHYVANMNELTLV